jgi:hypothetical protein
VGSPLALASPPPPATPAAPDPELAALRETVRAQEALIEAQARELEALRAARLGASHVADCG